MVVNIENDHGIQIGGCQKNEQGVKYGSRGYRAKGQETKS